MTSNTPTCWKQSLKLLSNAEHKVNGLFTTLYVYYITSAMTSYTPTRWKQSFHQHNTTIKFLQIHIDFVIYPTGFTSP